MWVVLVPHLALAQIQGSDVLSTSGQYDRFAVGNAHRWYDKHSADARQKSAHCLSILDEAHAIQDTALALDEEARRPGLNSRQATALRKRANEQFGLRDMNIGAFIDCFNQSNRRPMLQGRVERNEVPPDQQPDSGKQPDPRRRKTASPPPRRVPPPNDPGPAEPATLPIPPSPDSGDQKLPPGGATNQRPGRHRFGTPDPPFMFADGVSKGMGDCFAENLPSDLATAPLAIIKRLDRIKKAVEIIGKAGSVYAIYEDIKSYDPTADPYETGKWLGKLICDGKDLGEVVRQKQKPLGEEIAPAGTQPKPPTQEDSNPNQASPRTPPSGGDGGFTAWIGHRSIRRMVRNEEESRYRKTTSGSRP